MTLYVFFCQYHENFTDNTSHKELLKKILRKVEGEFYLLPELYVCRVYYRSRPLPCFQNKWILRKKILIMYMILKLCNHYTIVIKILTIKI